MTDDRDTSNIRPPAARTVTAAVLFTAVLVGAAFLVINRLHSLAGNVVEHPGSAATDAQTQSEVVEQAKAIVAIAAIQRPTASYLLMSCKDNDNPPYQGAVYLDFQLPSDISADQYFRTITAAMVAHGWREGLPPNQHMFGRNLSKDGVNAILYPDRDSTTHGIGRIYGQCHDMNSHRGAAWIDVTDRLH
ncbi:hypothetical protein [Mycobacterium sp.]|uniref:hypothetical protein n=1 Tax=Mycobacterium sp. TaxID=1785 RepID=UPI003BB12AFC